MPLESRAGWYRQILWRKQVFCGAVRNRSPRRCHQLGFLHPTRTCHLPRQTTCGAPVIGGPRIKAMNRRSRQDAVPPPRRSVGKHREIVSMLAADKAAHAPAAGSWRAACSKRNCSRAMNPGRPGRGPPSPRESVPSDWRTWPSAPRVGGSWGKMGSRPSKVGSWKAVYGKWQRCRL
jgi:hypothetical protein